MTSVDQRDIMPIPSNSQITVTAAWLNLVAYHVLSCILNYTSFLFMHHLPNKTVSYSKMGSMFNSSLIPPLHLASSSLLSSSSYLSSLQLRQSPKTADG